MMNSRAVLFTTLMFLLNFVAGAAPIQTKELPPIVPGTLDWDYIGNSFSDFAVDAENGVGRWVQNFVDEIEVTPDGTVIVGCDRDVGGPCLGLYKDGRISAPKEIAQNTGWIDLSHGLRTRELGGTYHITQEDNLRAKVILHIWKP